SLPIIAVDLCRAVLETETGDGGEGDGAVPGVDPQIADRLQIGAIGVRDPDPDGYLAIVQIEPRQGFDVVAARGDPQGIADIRGGDTLFRRPGEIRADHQLGSLEGGG